MRTFHHGLRGGHTTLFQPVHYRTGLPDSVAAGNERGSVGNPGHCRIHPLIEERNNGVIPFNDLPDIKPYPVLLLQDKQRINHLIKAVHAKLCGVQTLYLSTPRSLTVLYRQSYPAWCQSVHNFSIGAAYHR